MRIWLGVLFFAACGGSERSVGAPPVAPPIARPERALAPPPPSAPTRAVEPAPAPVTPAPVTRRVAWLPGFQATAVSATANESADDVGAPRAGCPTGDTRAHRLVADIAPRAGDETIVASTANGIVVLDSQGQTVASAALPCGGSDDELIAIAAGDAGIGGRVIAVLARTGGRREAITRLELLRVGDGHELERVFSAPIETRDDDTIASGEVRIVAGGLRVRVPGGGLERWSYDPVARRYHLRGGGG